MHDYQIGENQIQGDQNCSIRRGGGPKTTISQMKLNKIKNRIIFY